jgi:thiol:disulfide interchange protein DsbA
MKRIAKPLPAVIFALPGAIAGTFAAAFAALMLALAGPLMGPLMGALMGVAVTGSTAYAAEAFVEGEHFERLPIAVETRDPNKVEVVEVFSYACVHCYSFDPTLDAWRHSQNDGVIFRRVPAIFNQTWELLAQAFFTAEVLGVTEKVHTPMFTAIHRDGTDLRNPALLASLFETHADIGEQQFMQVFNSFSVRSMVQQAKAHGKAYRVTGVPSLVVNGKYRVDGRLAGDNSTMLRVVDYLLGEEAAAMTPSASPEGAQ